MKSQIALSTVFLVAGSFSSTKIFAEGAKASMPDKAPFVAPAQESSTGNASANNDASKTRYRISGQIVAAQESELSFRVAGFIDEILKKPGEMVKKGDALARLDLTDNKLALELASARTAQAKIALAAAKKELDRENMLRNQNASTGTTFDQIKANYDSSRVGVQVAELNEKTADRNLQTSTLTAPYDLVIAEQLKHAGEYVSIGLKTFKVYALGNHEIDLNVPEMLTGKIEVGTNLTISVPSAGFKGTAKVTRVVPVVSQQTRTFKVIAKIDEESENVLPGLFAEALLN